MRSEHSYKTTFDDDTVPKNTDSTYNRSYLYMRVVQRKVGYS